MSWVTPEHFAAQVILNVCELPDYTSPDDQPELLQCTVKELEACVLQTFEHFDQGESYICEGCGGSFKKTRSDDEAAAAALEIFPAPLLEDKALICDDCYRLMMRNFVAHFERLRARAGEIRKIIDADNTQVGPDFANLIDELLEQILIEEKT